MPKTVDTTVYSYKPKKLTMVLCFTLFGIATIILAYIALHDDRGLNLVIFRHILELSFTPYQAKLFWAVLSIGSAAFSLAGLFGIYKAFTLKTELVLTRDEIHIPLNFSKTPKIAVIPFHEILSLELHKVAGVRKLKIIYKNGTAVLNEDMLPKKALFDEITSRLMVFVEQN